MDKGHVDDVKSLDSRIDDVPTILKPNSEVTHSF